MITVSILIGTALFHWHYVDPDKAQACISAAEAAVYRRGESDVTVFEVPGGQMCCRSDQILSICFEDFDLAEPDQFAVSLLNYRRKRSLESRVASTTESEDIVMVFEAKQRQQRIEKAVDDAMKSADSSGSSVGITAKL